MNPSEFSLNAQVACVRREAGLRKFLYAKRIAAGKMTQEEADREIACMEAVLVTLTALMIAQNKRSELRLFDDSPTA